MEGVQGSFTIESLVLDRMKLEEGEVRTNGSGSKSIF